MKSFLQSKDWANFQQSFGRKVFWIANKLVIKYDLLLGKSWLYCARPDFKDYNSFICHSRAYGNPVSSGSPMSKLRFGSRMTLKKFLHNLGQIAKKENVIFAKIEPDINVKVQMSNVKPNSNIKCQMSKCLQPQDSLLLNLTQSEKEILENMHPKTRYNIRLAEKHGIKIKKSSDPADIDIFYNLALKTSQRDGFKYHSRDYYKKMLEVLGGNSELKVELFIAYKQSENSKSQIPNDKQIPNSNFQKLQVTSYKLHEIPLAAILVAFYKDTAIYLHGASDHDYRKYMAPYLLQWSAIKEAKKRKCKFYDFWGISPIEQISNNKSQIPNSNSQSPKKFTPLRNEVSSAGLIEANEVYPVVNSQDSTTGAKKLSDHPWSGITRFKLGFATPGKVVHYPDCFDIVYQPRWYQLYKFVKKLKG